jgi:hypothetical protein
MTTSPALMPARAAGVSSIGDTTLSVRSGMRHAVRRRRRCRRPASVRRRRARRASPGTRCADRGRAAGRARPTASASCRRPDRRRPLSPRCRPTRSGGFRRAAPSTSRFRRRRDRRWRRPRGASLGACCCGCGCGLRRPAARAWPRSRAAPAARAREAGGEQQQQARRGRSAWAGLLVRGGAGRASIMQACRAAALTERAGVSVSAATPPGSTGWPLRRSSKYSAGARRAGVADAGQRVAALDAVAGVAQQRVVVRVQAHVAVAVVDDEDQAVAIHPVGEHDAAIGDRLDRRARGAAISTPWLVRPSGSVPP